jgi:hypothetical protein
VRESGPDDPVRVNQTVGALSRAILSRRPLEYLQWLCWGLREGLTAILFLALTNKPAVLCLGALLVCEAVDLRRRRRGPLAVETAVDRGVARRARQVLVWTAVGFAAMKLLLVVLVEVPNHRYMTAASVFVPALLAVLCVDRRRCLMASSVPGDRSAPTDRP